MKNYIILGTAILGLLATNACKKDDPTTSKYSLSGLSVNTTAPYVALGSEFEFNADVRYLAAGDGGTPTVGIYWQVNSAKKDTLTKNVAKSNPAFTYKVDTLGTYNVYCYAFDIEGNYYNTSAAASFVAVDPDKVLTDIAEAEEITVGGKTWMARNLNNQDAGLSFRESTVMDAPLGRLYNWTEAQSACPAGWHLPTLEDYKASFGNPESGVIPSADLMADASFLGKKIWEYFPDVQITNKYGFNAICLGYIDTVDSFNAYNKYGEYACYWTAGEKDGMGQYLYIYAAQPTAYTGVGDKETLYMSVRCVKD